MLVWYLLVEVPLPLHLSRYNEAVAMPGYADIRLDVFVLDEQQSVNSQWSEKLVIGRVPVKRRWPNQHT